MPHYADGTEAKIGDLVRGKPYNTDHEVIGYVTSITKGTDACNCQVAFAKKIEPNRYSAVPAVVVPANVNEVGQSTPEDHGYLHFQVVTDYGELRAFGRVA